MKKILIFSLVVLLIGTAVGILVYLEKLDSKITELVKKTNSSSATTPAIEAKLLSGAWVKEDLEIIWKEKNSQLSEVENEKILNQLYPNYKSIIDKYTQLKTNCPALTEENLNGFSSCTMLNSEKPNIQLFLVGEVKDYSLPVYYLIVPYLFVDGPTSGYSAYLAIYDTAKNRLVRINPNLDENTIDLNPVFGLYSYPDLTKEEQNNLSLALFSETKKMAFQGLTVPNKISIPDQDETAFLKLVGTRYAFLSDWHNIGEYGDFGINITEFDKTNEEKFTGQQVVFIDPKLGNVYFNGECYFIINAVGSVFVYDLQPYFLNPMTPAEAEKSYYSNAQLLNVTWNDGVKDEEELFINGRTGGGCGFSLSGCPGIVQNVKSFTAENLVEIAKTEKGESIYELRDKFSNSVYWEMYKTSGQAVEGVYNLKTDIPTKKELSLIGALDSYEKFLDNRPLLFWKDFAGHWRQLQKTKYIPAAECGKPVIYLYPEKDTDIKVEVKPNGGFTKTEPMYDNGWFVRATTQSELFNYADKTNYPYLFWEGKAYNFVTPNYGFVMSKNEVSVKMPQILAKLGLNEKETKDFLEFWQPKLEVKPYVFVTFLPQREFDKLAPLTVNPRPDTIIRVFMDYIPLDAPINVAPMQIRTPERVGFTVVEWGGRLH